MFLFGFFSTEDDVLSGVPRRALSPLSLSAHAGGEIKGERESKKNTKADVTPEPLLSDPPPDSSEEATGPVPPRPAPVCVCV